MNFFEILILGIVEGFTEFLPVSSTAHLLITGEILGLEKTEFFKTFVIAIQVGAIVAVLFVYTKRVLENLKIAKKIAVAFIPTATIGIISYKFIKNFLLESLPTIAWALIVGGVVILIFEHIKGEKIKNEDEQKLEDISYKKSFVLGVVQALAIIPGVSRSGATIIGGMLSGISRKNIVEFSFLLAVPTIAGASFFELYSSPISFDTSQFWALGLGLLFSFVFAILSIRFFLNFIKQNSFKIFGWYRVVAGGLILMFLV